MSKNKAPAAWSSEERDIATVIPYEKNPRKNDQAVGAVAESIRQFGFRQPIVVDAQGVIIAGHTRLKAAQLLGLPKVPVHVAKELTPEQVRALRIADNKLHELAQWDVGILASELEGLVGMEALGFEEDELKEIAFGRDAQQGLTDPDDVPEPPVDPITKPGDLWILGKHRLLCGDSTNAEDVERLMAGAKADLCFTSPPYGAAKSARLRDHYVPGAAKRESFYDQHEDDPDSWPDLMANWFAAFRPVSECVICNVQMLADNKRAMVRWLADRSDDLVDVIVWDKINAAPQMQANVLSNAFEFCFVFGGNASRAIPFADFHGTLSNVLRLDPRGKNDHADKHRAVFPLELPAWFMRSLCRKSKTVADPFCGTGTTLIAAEQLGRKCYGMEISPQYCDVVVNRWEKFTGRKAERATG